MLCKKDVLEISQKLFLKIRIRKSRQNAEKIPVKEFTFTKVAGLTLVTQLKMNSATDIF